LRSVEILEVVHRSGRVRGKGEKERREEGIRGGRREGASAAREGSDLRESLNALRHPPVSGWQRRTLLASVTDKG
jgi:hypothetical protein